MPKPSPTFIAKRYQVLAELGKGGMGTVYRVADKLEKNRELALKVIRAEGAVTPDLKLRFKEEFRAMAKLAHPNTVEVFDFGQTDDQALYLTMELVDGVELTARLQEGPMPFDEIYRLLIQLLQALGFIHSRAYVHRDIKSQNIRITPEGTLKLMDFGLMAPMGMRAAGNSLTGSPGYLPPEVVKGGVIDAASDLYSVGCLAYELVTGQVPFRGKLIEMVRQHLDAAPTPPRQLRPETPEKLEQVILQLLEKEPSRRYNSAVEVTAELAGLAGLAVGRENLEQKKSYLRASELVGRDAERQALESGLAAVAAGRGHAHFVGAPAGVGKSRLAQEITLAAKLAEMPVLLGQCLESGMSPYEPLIEALTPALPLTSPETFQRLGPELIRLFPGLARLGHPPKPLPVTDAERLALKEAVVAWLAELATAAPVLLAFEDLHWADAQSLEVFNHCIRALADRPVYCLATLRNDELPAGHPAWFTVEEGFTHYLKLRPFELEQVMQLLDAMLQKVRISDEFVRYLYKSTAGNAFFLTEVLRYLIEENVLTRKDGVWHFPSDTGNLVLLTSVEATVLRRLVHLSDDARKLARVAAVCGPHQDRPMLLAVSAMEEDRLFAALDELIERQFIWKEDLRFTFPHDRVREALYHDLPESERRELHERCGAYLETAHAGRTAAIVKELAHHFSRGHDRDRAYKYLWLAGHQAKDAGAAAVAMAHWKEAEEVLASLVRPDREALQVDLWWEMGSTGFGVTPRPAAEALEKLVAVLEAQWSIDLAAALLKKTVELAKRLPAPLREPILDTRRRAKPYRHRIRRGAFALLPPSLTSWVPRLLEAYAYQATVYGFIGQPERGLAVAERARALLPFPNTPLEGTLWVVESANCNAAGRYDQAIEKARRATELLAGRDIAGSPTFQRALAGAYGFQASGCFQGVRPEAGLQAAAIAVIDQLQDLHLYNAIWGSEALWAAWSGRPEEAEAVIERIVQNCRKLGDPPFPWVLYLRPYLLFQQGEFEEARALAQRALAAEHLQDDFARQMLLVLDGEIRLALGDYDAAMEAFVTAEKRGTWGQMQLVTLLALLGRGELALRREDPRVARQYLEQARAAASGGPARNPRVEARALRLLAEAAVAEGAHAEAEQHLEAGLALMAAQDNRIEEAHLHRALGELHFAREEREKALGAYREAGARYHAMKNRFYLHAVNDRLETLHRQPAPKEEAAVHPDARWKFLSGLSL